MTDESMLDAEDPYEDLDPSDEESDEDRRGAGWYSRRGCVGRLFLIIVALFVVWYVLTHLRSCEAPDQADNASTASVAMVKVPNVVGMKRADALRALKAAGLGVEVDELYDADAVSGTVAKQSPAAGDTVEKGTLISIDVFTRLTIGNDAPAIESDYTNAVPDVVGMMRGDAVAMLESAGYGVEVLEVYSFTQPVGVVFDQTPPGGNRAEPGSTVVIMLSLGKTPPADTVVPDLEGLTQSQAAAKVAAAGLVFRPMWQPKASSVGRVYDQSPIPGTAAHSGDYVHVLIGVAQSWQ